VIRHGLLRQGLATAALWVAGLALGRDARPATPVPAPSAPASPSGLRAALYDVPLERGGSQTLWVVDWDQVEGVDGYEVTYRTSEGASGRSTLVDRPPLRLEVARDDRAQPSSAVRSAQLTAIRSLLALRVTPHFPGGGRQESPWPWLEVGVPYPAQ
jgi:hypothetical protein